LPAMTCPGRMKLGGQWEACTMRRLSQRRAQFEQNPCQSLDDAATGYGLWGAARSRAPATGHHEFARCDQRRGVPRCLERRLLRDPRPCRRCGVDGEARHFCAAVTHRCNLVVGRGPVDGCTRRRCGGTCSTAPRVRGRQEWVASSRRATLHPPGPSRRLRVPHSRSGSCPGSWREPTWPRTAS